MLLPRSTDEARLCTYSPGVVSDDRHRVRDKLGRMRKQLTLLCTAALLATAIQSPVTGQARPAPTRPTLSNAVRAYVSVDAPVIALTHARVIDGTGAEPRENQTLILNNGVIATIGSSASTDVPAGAQTIDLTGKSVIPGLV